LQAEENRCPTCAALAQISRGIADRDQKHREQNKDAPPGNPLPSDGLHVHLRALTPQEAQERAQRAAQKAKGGEHG
jgi:hypothetical protein